MSLPKILAQHSTITVEGETVDIRSLTRAEVAKIRKMAADGATLDELEMVVLQYGTDTPKEDVVAWYETTPSHAVDPIITAIRELSRVDEEEAQKSG